MLALRPSSFATVEVQSVCFLIFKYHFSPVLVNPPYVIPPIPLFARFPQH